MFEEKKKADTKKKQRWLKFMRGRLLLGRSKQGCGLSDIIFV